MPTYWIAVLRMAAAPSFSLKSSNSKVSGRSALSICVRPGFVPERFAALAELAATRSRLQLTSSWRTAMPCSAQMLADVELFEHLNDEDRLRLAEVVDLKNMDAGMTLFSAGEPGDSLFVVRT